MQPRNNTSAGCGGKRKYSSNAAAVQAALSLHARASKGKPAAYFCGVCGSFHIGRKGGMHAKPRIEPDEDNMLLEKMKRESASEVSAKSYGENRELSWLAQRVARGQKEPFSEIATITPSIAKHILERNDDNRSLKDGLVRQIATDIASGLWQLNGESIIIAKDGSLNDGQHRLSAVVESGKPIQTVIMFGVSRASRDTVDMGSARSVGDIIGMHGGKYATTAASVSQLLMMFRRGAYSIGDGGRGTVSRRPTKQEILAYYARHGKEIDKSVARTINDKFFKKTGPTSWPVAYAILSRINPDAAELFFTRAASGENLSRGDAILTMRGHFLEHPARIRSWERLELIIRYWNAWRKRKPTSRRIASLGSYPEIEG